MKAPAFLSHSTWRWGIAICLVGVLVAKLLVPEIGPELRRFAQAGANLVAFTGIFVIAWGISRRMREARENSENPPHGS